MGAEDRAGDHRMEGDWGGIQHKAGRFMVRETIFDFISLTYSPEHELQLFALPLQTLTLIIFCSLYSMGDEWPCSRLGTWEARTPIGFS